MNYRTINGCINLTIRGLLVGTLSGCGVWGDRDFNISIKDTAEIKYDSANQRHEVIFEVEVVNTTQTSIDPQQVIITYSAQGDIRCEKTVGVLKDTVLFPGFSWCPEQTVHLKVPVPILGPKLSDQSLSYLATKGSRVFNFTVETVEKGFSITQDRFSTTARKVVKFKVHPFATEFFTRSSY